MRVFLLVCLGIIGLTQAQQERCCLPDDQFILLKGITTASTPASFWGRLSGQLQISEYQSVAYDFTNKRFAAKIYRSFVNKPYPPQNVRVVEDAAQRVSWVIDLDKQTCSRENPEEFPFRVQRCISDYFQDLGPLSFGDKELQTVTYFASYSDESGSAQYTISVSPKCIPIGETIVGTVKSWKVKQQLVANGGFFNYTVGIEDPDSYFTLPDYCAQAEEEEESGFFDWLF